MLYLHMPQRNILTNVCCLDTEAPLYNQDVLHDYQPITTLISNQSLTRKEDEYTPKSYFLLYILQIHYLLKFFDCQ